MAEELKEDLSLASGYRRVTAGQVPGIHALDTLDTLAAIVKADGAGDERDKVVSAGNERQMVGTGGLPASCFQVVSVERLCGRAGAPVVVSSFGKGSDGGGAAQVERAGRDNTLSCRAQKRLERGEEEIVGGVQVAVVVQIVPDPLRLLPDSPLDVAARLQSQLADPESVLRGGTWTRYLDSIEKQSGISGVGILLERAQDMDWVLVRKLVPGGPAWENGMIREGNMIVSVDGQSVCGWPMDSLCRHMTGPEGSKVTLALSIKPRSLINDDHTRPDDAVITHSVTLERRPIVRGPEVQEYTQVHSIEMEPDNSHFFRAPTYAVSPSAKTSSLPSSLPRSLPSSALATNNGLDPAMGFTSSGKSLEEAGKSLEKIIAKEIWDARRSSACPSPSSPLRGASSGNSSLGSPLRGASSANSPSRMSRTSPRSPIGSVFGLITDHLTS